MITIEVEYVQILTCNISDKDERRIIDYIKSNPDEFEFMPDEKKIVHAIHELEIDLFKEDYVESDGYTNDVSWSEFEERSAGEILNENLIDALNER